jgi:acetyl esterase/lipase
MRCALDGDGVDRADGVIRAATLGTLLAALIAAGPAGAGRPFEGPFGEGAAQVWVLRPAAAIRSVVVFGHGWKSTPPTAGHPWVDQFRPWLDHLLAGGSAVVFPRYQLGGDGPGPARVAAFHQGVALGLRRLGTPEVPVVAIGYSYGGSLAVSYAANAARWRLPQPEAVDAVFPAGPVPGSPLPRLAPGVKALLQVGDSDVEAGRSGADAFWRWLRGRGRYEVIHSTGGFVATHAAPKSIAPEARRVFWTPLDRLIAAARSG